MLHPLGARLLLSPAISSFLIKGTEGSKYTPAFFGKQAGTATCARGGVCACLCVHVNVQEPQMGFSCPVTPNKGRAASATQAASSPHRKEKTADLGACENLHVPGGVSTLRPMLPDPSRVPFCSL